jgi:hypothetical protein
VKLDRRRLLETTGVMLAATALYRPTLARATAALTLVDASFTREELRAAGAVPAHDAGTIQPDLVRQWRDGLGQQVALATGMTAYVRWDKLLLLTGLARESGLTARQRRLDRSVFVVSIG